LLGLLKRRFPRLAMTGVEPDATLLDLAKQFFVKEQPEAPLFINASLPNTALPDATFDIAVLRLVLEHLSEPLHALREAGRILKPEGKIVVIDNDFDFHLRTWPPVHELDDYYSAYCAAREKDGGHPRIGRQLPMLLKQAGFTAPSLEILCAHNQVVGDQPFLKSEGQGIPDQLAKTGFLDGKYVYKLKKQWAAMLRVPDHAIIRQLFYASGIKPKGN
jgi:SAM-dependent methyltransferase